LQSAQAIFVTQGDRQQQASSALAKGYRSAPTWRFSTGWTPSAEDETCRPVVFAHS